MEQNEQQLIDDGYARHYLCAEPPDHDVVEQADKVGYSVLYHYRHRHRKNRAVECLASYVFFNVSHISFFSAAVCRGSLVFLRN